MNAAQTLLQSLMTPMPSVTPEKKVYKTMVTASASEIFEWNAAVDIKNKKKADRKKGAK